MSIASTSESSTTDPVQSAPTRRCATHSAIRKIRYTPEEWTTIVTRSAQCQLPPATYVRITSLGVTPKVPRAGVNAAVLHQLARLGNNLNQLARVANATGKMPTEARCHIILDHVLAAISRID